MSRPTLLVSLALAFLALACSSGVTAPDPDPISLPTDRGPADSVTAFVGVRVVPMDREEVLDGHTVLVRNGRIAELAPDGEVSVPDGARIIRGRGRWLMPGLADAHVHMSSTEAPEYVAYGITTVRNMWGWPGLREIQARIRSGDLLGPTIHSYSSGLDAPPTYWPYTQVVTRVADARRVVGEQLAQGWLGIKVYRDLAPDVYRAILSEAFQYRKPVVGHVPAAVDVEEALRLGQLSLEHLLGYDRALGGRYGGWSPGFDEERMRELARLTAEVGAWNCPTLSILRHKNPGDHGARIRAVRILHEEGAPLLAGSDAGIDVTAPGVSLHEELGYMEDAGLSPYEALRTATVEVAAVLGQPGVFGIVAPGARADLLLLDGNPLEGVANAGAPAGVMLRGLWIPGS